MSESYTIKMLADELGISKQAVRKRINQLPTNLLSTASDGKTILISSEGADILRGKPAEKVSTKVSTDSVNFDTNLVDSMKGQIEDLRKEVEFLKKQIEIKDNQIEVQQKQIESWDNALNDVKLLATRQPLLIEDKPKEESKVKKFFERWFIK